MICYCCCPFWEIACFHVRSTYAAFQVSIMLDMSVFTSVVVFFCLGISLKGKKNHYLLGFEALLGR